MAITKSISTFFGQFYNFPDQLSVAIEEVFLLQIFPSLPTNDSHETWFHFGFELKFQQVSEKYEVNSN